MPRMRFNDPELFSFLEKEKNQFNQNYNQNLSLNDYVLKILNDYKMSSSHYYDKRLANVDYQLNVIQNEMMTLMDLLHEYNQRTTELIKMIID